MARARDKSLRPLNGIPRMGAAPNPLLPPSGSRHMAEPLPLSIDRPLFVSNSPAAFPDRKRSSQRSIPVSLTNDSHDQCVSGRLACLKSLHGT